MIRVRSHRTAAAIGAALLATLALAACAGGDNSAGSSADSAASSPQAGFSDESGGRAADSGNTPSSAGSPGKGASGSSADPVTTANLAASQDSLARRASIALKVKNIGQAVAKVRATTATAQGIVLSENIGTAAGDAPLAESAKVTATTYGEITISVPSAELDRVIAELGSVGTVIRSTSSSENVGGQIVDTTSRLQTMRVSVERVRAFLEDAKDLNQIVALEAELTRRQSDLEALEAQLASLKGSVARSPIQISLTTEPGAIVEEPDQAGFLVGLKGGWDAFTASLSVLLTVLGALLPFLALFALLGLPVWWYLRRRRPVNPSPTVLPQ
ncbi:DUF4349 domain-containing protein [Phycicoccus sp. Soil802]|uniref:DUF4349 domain-containing protein n=1 Tax=Phycicoccus sp. Soil802 TaxID=1736414 RepID=UPI0007035FB3|nr:DUF4349 domain-containing protein [Phycicoccus sp. Soil802]KRF29705.1 hypothetical protein ASG91_01465 [Phycicoccus sp. Soil802]